METSDGFAFTRRTANRGAKLAFSRIEAPNTHTKHTAAQEFSFNRLQANTAVSITNPARTRRARRQKEAQAGEGGIKYNVVKKRKTVRLDKSIDLSSASIIVDTPKDACLTDDTLRIDLPLIKEKVKSHEIYTQVSTGNINDLIIDCVKFLGERTSYSAEVIKHCNANYFSDIDYRKEIETSSGRMEQIKEEIAKWGRVYQERKAANSVDVRELVRPSIEMKFDRDGICMEFEEKAARLRAMEDRLKYFFEHAREKSESLLKSIFGSLEEKSVDALFLLKAMSRLGR